MKFIFLLFSFLLFSGSALAETNYVYTGKTIDLPLKKGKMYEIVLPEPFTEWKTNLSKKERSKFFLMSSVDGSKNVFIKIKDDSKPIKIHFIGAYTENTYVLRADFLSDKDDDVYRIIGDVYDVEKESKKREKSLTKMSYEEAALAFGKDMMTRENDSSYNKKTNLNIEILKQKLTFKFILKESYSSKRFIGYKILVINKLPVAQPFNKKKFYMPGLIMSSMNADFLERRADSSREYFKGRDRSFLYLVFDRNNKSFRERVYGK